MAFHGLLYIQNSYPMCRNDYQNGLKKVARHHDTCKELKAQGTIWCDPLPQQIPLLRVWQWSGCHLYKDLQHHQSNVETQECPQRQ